MHLLPLILFFFIFSNNAQYDGYKVFEVIPLNKRQSTILEKMYKSRQYDFWSGSRLLYHPSVIMVSPTTLQYFTHLMKINSFYYEELIDDVSKFDRTTSRVCKEISQVFSLHKYNTYEGINGHLNELENRYPNNVKKILIGTTVEGRNIFAIKISSEPETNNEIKPAILIDAGIHAREWISTATALYFINQLTEFNKEMIQDVDWYIIPLLNPDGYVYTQKTDRFWRKNRSRGQKCYGVDDNRNFGYHWMDGGSSSNECSEIYAGPAPFSEAETKGFRNFVLKHKNNIKLYLSLHSYGCFILYPWSFSTPSSHCRDYNELQKIGENVGKTIGKVNGRKYKVGSSRNILYEASGNSEDWMKGVVGVQLSFAMELPGGGNEGFDIADNKIIEVASETFEGVKRFYEYVVQKYG